MSKPIRCAGLHWNGACAKQQQCANYAKWWLTDGVEAAACNHRLAQRMERADSQRLEG